MSDPLITPLLNQVADYLPPKSVSKIESAFEFAKAAHNGQCRSSGDPYITHPVAVATILANLKQGPSTIIAALLHDVIEDCQITPEDVRTRFGDTVCTLVEGVTKLGRIKFHSKKEEQAENFRKMFLAMAQDIRVVIIKLADRLHNMRTLEFVNPQKQERIARETRDIFSPLAHRLGMWSIKWELEDLAFSVLQKEEFDRIRSLITEKRDERESYVSRITQAVEEELEKRYISATVKGRPKHFYSIYKKLLSRGIEFEKLYDTLGIRILVDDIKSCYEVLGVIHSLFKPINGRFKDYIALPKSNFYQSLHTTVIAYDGKPVEVQIRTHDMHQIAEMGVAAHWRYKEGNQKREFDFAWLREILNLQSETPSSEEFLEDVKLDLFIDEVFVFSPKGDVIVLPKGATPLDFAYKIHSEIGDACSVVRVNDRVVGFDYVLRSGDRLDVITSKNQHPTLQWLDFVITRHARSKIRQWFKRQKWDESVQQGKEELERALVLAQLVPKEVLTSKMEDLLLADLKQNSMQDLYILIARGEIPPNRIVTSIRAHLDLPPPTKRIVKPPKRIPSSSTSASKGIMVYGERNVESNFAKCCSPLPGDDILGFITQGHGISVHRSDCPNIMRAQEAQPDRIVDVDWDLSIQSGVFHVEMCVEGLNRVGLLNDILSKLADSKINIHAIRNVSTIEGDTIMRANISVDVQDQTQYRRVVNIISQVKDVITIQRIKGR